MHISLITSLYRTEAHLKDFLHHQNQLNADLTAHGIQAEFILVANDATPTEIALLAPLTNDDHTQVIHTERESLYSSWNRGIAHATAPVIGFWNVDDRRTAPAILEALEHFRAECDLVDAPLDVVEGGRYRYTRAAMFNPVDVSPKHLAGTFFMFTRALYERTGAFNGHFRICGDMEWSTRPTVRACRYAHTQASGGDFVIHGDNLSQGMNEREWVEINIVLLWREAYEHLRPVSPELMRDNWQAWGYEGADIPPHIADWLWGEGAQARYQAHKAWHQRPRLWQKVRLWLTFRLGLPHPERDFKVSRV